MADADKKLFLEQSEALNGAAIEVSETGFSARGVVTEVTVDDDGFSIDYTSSRTDKAYRFAGAWGWASVLISDDEVCLSVPMVGSAVIRP